MTSLAVVDSSALIAAADRSDPAHARCLDVLGRRELELVIPALVVAESTYVIGKRLGPGSEAAFVRGLGPFWTEAPSADEWAVIADLAEQYADFPLGTVDASVVVLADRLETDLIVTLDRRHFGAVKSPAGRRFRLLPVESAVHEQAAAYEADSE